MWQMITGIGSLISVVITSAMFIAVKFNDVKHIQLAVEKIEKNNKEATDKIEQSICEVKKDIAEFKLYSTKTHEQLTGIVEAMQARCEERHSKVMRVRKVKR